MTELLNNKKDRVDLKKWTIITAICTILLILLTYEAKAAIEIDWLTPSYRNQILDDYPQTIRYFARSDGIISYCNTTIEGTTYQTTLNSAQNELYKELKLGQGNYTLTATCVDGDGTYTSNTLVKIDDMATLNRRQERNFQWTLWLTIYGFLLLVYLISPDNKRGLYKIVASMGLLAISIGLTQITKHPIIWIPITLSVILIIMEIAKKAK